MKYKLLYVFLAIVSENVFANNFANNPADNSIEFRGKRHSPSKLSEEIYNEVINAYFQRESLFTLAAAKCYERMDREGINIPDKAKEEFRKILELEDSWLFTEHKKHNAQAFYLMYCGHMIPVDTSKVVTRHSR